MVRKRTLRPEETAIWKKVARSVTPLSPDRSRLLEEMDAAAKPAEPSKKPVSKSRLRATTTPLKPAAPPTPVDRSGEKKIRKGKLGIDSRIDLHGMTQDQALSALTGFLHRAQHRHDRTVLVITGKGYKLRARANESGMPEEEPGILRRRLPEWLARPELKAIVSGFAPAHARHGGGGAFYVTLRKPEPIRHR